MTCNFWFDHNRTCKESCSDGDLRGALTHQSLSRLQRSFFHLRLLLSQWSPYSSVTTITRKLKYWKKFWDQCWFNNTHVKESVAYITERECEMVSVAAEKTRRRRFLLARRRGEYVEEDYDVTVTEEVVKCPLQRRPRRFFILYNHHDPPYFSHYYSCLSLSLSSCLVWKERIDWVRFVW